jgi:hypothetical protein
VDTPLVAGRVPDDLVKAARTAAPELADAPVSVLLRVALAVLAGLAIRDAIRAAREQSKSGPGNGMTWPPRETAPEDRAGKPAAGGGQDAARAA